MALLETQLFFTVVPTHAGLLNHHNSVFTCTGELCGDGWSHVGEACLRINASRDSYDNAQHYCKNLGGNIASLLTDKQVHYVLEELQKYQLQDAVGGGNNGFKVLFWPHTFNKVSTYRILKFLLFKSCVKAADSVGCSPFVVKILLYFYTWILLTLKNEPWFTCWSLSLLFTVHLASIKVHLASIKVH